ncbi:hypothetical protein GVAV_001139 [Gurleya vavrai]
MNLEKVGIINYFNSKPENLTNVTLKKKYEDFIVKEICESGFCDDADIFEINEIDEAINFVMNEIKEKNNGILHRIKNEKIDFCTFIEKNNTFEEDFIKENYFEKNNHIKEDNFKENSIEKNNEYNNNIDNNNVEKNNIIDNNLENKDREDFINLYDFSNEKDINLFQINNLDKNERTKIHKIINKHPLLNSKTNQNGHLQVDFCKSNKFYEFTMKKINKNTVEACNFICSMLKISFNKISFAGNKDKRAITYQKIVVEGCKFFDLINLAYKFKKENGNISIFNIKQCGSHLKLGNLLGNKFIIAIKDKNENLDSELEKIDEAKVKKLENGFINYYGQQRFGKNFDNHLLGKMILNNEYEKFINEVMSIKESDTADVNDAKIFFKEKKYEKASVKFPYRYIVEKNICRGRNRNFSDKKIVLGIKREVLKLYLHAYQSFNFNDQINKEIENCDDKNKLKDKILDLKIEKNKHLKGGKRKMIEKAFDVHLVKNLNSITIHFSLPVSCYATMALREIIGDSVLFEK